MKFKFENQKSILKIKNEIQKWNSNFQLAIIYNTHTNTYTFTNTYTYTYTNTYTITNTSTNTYTKILSASIFYLFKKLSQRIFYRS